MKRAPHNRRVRAELGLPQRMTDEQHPCAALFFALRETAAKLRPYSKHRQQIPRHRLAVEMDGARNPGERKRSVMLRNEVLEATVARPPIEKIGVRDSIELRLSPVPDGADLHQPLRLRIGQRTQHYRIHDAEHRGIGAHSKSQREDHHNCEAGRPPHLSNRVA